MIRLPILALFLLLLSGCNNISDKQIIENQKKIEASPYEPKEYVEITHPEWSKNATIYEVNIRQYTPEGTFKAFESHLPRLKAMGIDILWIMPIHPIGIKNRKGTLGSYYAVKDYYGVNPELGTMADFKALVDKAHEMGMYLIIDWVANHSSRDNELVSRHPEWYSKSPDGKFEPTPWYDWEDRIEFDYNQPGLRQYMTDAMKFWVDKTNIDGFRCDVAGFVPIDFWENTRSELDKIKPVFLLAEWESRDLHKRAFDMTYSWSLWDRMHAVTTKGENLNGLMEYLAHDVNSFPKNGYRMTFTDNHDKNSWEGTPYTNFGKGLEASIVLAATVNGMPLVYSGQEAGMNRSLAFFEKDSIQWKDHPFAQIYTRLFALKHTNQALWNGKYGGEMTRIFNDKPQQVLSFSREKNSDRVITLINYSKNPVTVVLNSEYQKGNYTELFSEEAYLLKGNDTLAFKPWEYHVLVQQKN